MALKDIPGASIAAGATGLLGDLVLTGGETVVSLIAFLIMQPDAWLSIAIYSERLAGMVAWLPQEPLQKLLIVAFALTIAVSLARLIQRWRDRRD